MCMPTIILILTPQKFYFKTERKIMENTTENTESKNLMNFGQAIEALNRGEKVSRKGWNGKGMYLWKKPVFEITPEICSDPKLKQAVIDNGGRLLGLPTICMYTHDSTGRKAVLTGWLASQSDIFAEDWVLVD